MKKIICHVELWDTLQHPVLLDCGQITELPECPLEKLDEMLAMYSQKYETNLIALYGAKAYNEKLAHDIYEYSVTNYEINDLEIEVN